MVDGDHRGKAPDSGLGDSVRERQPVLGPCGALTCLRWLPQGGARAYEPEAGLGPRHRNLAVTNRLELQLQSRVMGRDRRRVAAASRLEWAGHASESIRKM